MQKVTSSKIIIERGNLQKEYYLIEITGNDRSFRGKGVIE